MKAAILLALLGITLNVSAQTQSPTGASSPRLTKSLVAEEVSPYNITRRAPHYRIWQKVTKTTSNSGKTFYHTNSYTELATGLNHWNGTEWVASTPQIEITPNGAAATKTQHQVNFAANINTAGSIDLTMPDRRHLRSHIVGLAYYDEATSNSVMFAETKDSVGQLLSSSNQVIYTNAFTDFEADVRYTHRRNGFEQDVIFRSQPPSPTQYGLNPQTTRLQIWTEFLNPPEPTISSRQIAAPVHGAGASGRQTLYDERLAFGGMRMDRGQAFSIDGQTNQLAAVPVAKEWIHAQGRTFLVEQVLLNSVAKEIQTLPPAPAYRTNNPSRPPKGASLKLKLPGAKQQAKVQRPMQLAQQEHVLRPGLVLDYNTIIDDYTDFTFQADSTYYVSGEVDLYGTTTVEGGAVIKSGVPDAEVAVMADDLHCLTPSYRPAIFTCTNDDSVGEIISGSSGTPDLAITSYLWLPVSGTISNLFFRYAWNGVSCDAADVELWDCQFVNCSHPITLNADSATLGLHNVLITMDDSINNSDNFCDCDPGALTVYSEAVNISAENLTADLGSQDLMVYFMGLSDPTLTSVALTNSIIITPNLNAQYAWDGGDVGITPETNYTYYAESLPDGLFQTVGAASHYLASDSPCHGYGTIGVSSDLATDLTQKTTYPPNVYDGGVGGSNLTSSLNLYPDPTSGVLRDSPSGSTLDAGYHYDPIDYAFGCVVLSNATITVNPGTVIAGFMSSSGSGSFTTAFGYSPAGLAIDFGAQFACGGTPVNPARIVDYATVQEQSAASWSRPSALLETYTRDLSYSPQLNCQFADFSVIADDSFAVFADSYPTTGCDACADLGFQDSQFHGGAVASEYPTIDLINCLFERVDCELTPLDLQTAFFGNNTFYGGTFLINTNMGGIITQFNLCDQAILSDYLPGTNNAYYPAVSGGTDGGYNDYIFTDPPVYEAGPLGRFYLTNTSPLINFGDVTADLVGLYQYTTQTNQLKETNSPVDIGFHYVAVDGSGNPIDTDSDGIPDYVADANGNGLWDPGEIDWMIMLTDPNNIGPTGLQVYTPLKY